MVEKFGIAVLLSFIGGILLLLSGLFSMFSGSLFLVFIFGSGFIFLYFMLFASLVIVGISVMLINNPKNARILGLVTLILGAILLILNLRSVSFIDIPAMFGGSLIAVSGFIAVSGALLAVIGGALTLSWNPQRQPSVLDE